MKEDAKPVKQCVCFDKTFAELKASGAASLDEIIERFHCSTGCGLCRPYIQRMLATGETEFAVMPDA
jgi:NAD(P)H-nitrite reductase large subunit